MAETIATATALCYDVGKFQPKHGQRCHTASDERTGIKHVYAQGTAQPWGRLAVNEERKSPAVSAVCFAPPTPCSRHKVDHQIALVRKGMQRLS